MVKIFFTACCALVALVGVARADCISPASDSERAQCIGQELLASDKTINDQYQKLRAVLDDSGRSALKHQEIAWIKARAATCQIDSKESDREKWLASLLLDFNKTVCVVRFTDQRVIELETQYAAVTRGGTGQEPGSQPLPIMPPSADNAAKEPDVYDLAAQRFPTSGKWYFEAALAAGEIAKTSEASIFIGAQGVGFSSVGTLLTIRKHDIGSDPKNIGIALDLDDGKLYVRLNGAWQGEPGGLAGLDLRLGRPYIAKVSSSVSLTPYLDRGLVDLNFGQHAFVYAVPDGYVPLDPNGPRRVIAPD